MAAAAVDSLGPRLAVGLVVGPAADEPIGGVEFIAGGHPVPTESSERAGRRAMAIARDTRADDLLLVLLSGGASALMAVPASGLSLDDKRRTTDLLLRAGANIDQMNTVRKHLSAIKGGQLAAAARAECFTLALSDVVGDDLSVIASGPTVADPSIFEDALRVINECGIGDRCPEAVMSRLTRGGRGQEQETPKPDDWRLSRARASVLAGRAEAMQGAADEARQRGYEPIVIKPPIVGEARTAAEQYAGVLAGHVGTIARSPGASRRRLALVSSGETTVQVRGSGRGGRNQEFALRLAELVPSISTSIAIVSLGTDGVDGPTDAAGAIVDAFTLDRARQAGCSDPKAYLDRNDSYSFFAATGDLVRVGPTGTNVGDLQVALIALND
jgi:glycerate-2-kinase